MLAAAPMWWRRSCDGKILVKKRRDYVVQFHRFFIILPDCVRVLFRHPCEACQIEEFAAAGGELLFLHELGTCLCDIVDGQYDRFLFSCAWHRTLPGGE